MTVDLGELIDALDDASGGSDEAKYELIALGAEVVPELAARVACLGGFGKLTAIEIFQAVEDPCACSALIDLLADDDETVAEWSATALDALGCHDAIEPLRAAWRRSVAAQVPPDWTGPVAFRRALTSLGARQPVMPRLTAGLVQRVANTEMQLISSADLASVVNDLADHDQVVLGFTVWRPGDDNNVYWTENAHAEWDFDWKASWSDNVAAARLAALDAAAITAQGQLVHLDWVGQDDVTGSVDAVG